jgi:hypothetical protein
MSESTTLFTPATPDQTAAFRSAKQEWSQRLLRPAPAATMRAFAAAISPAPEENVVGVGIGEKIVDGKPTGIKAIKFLVRRKFAEDQVGAGHLLPGSVNGLPVDVEQVGILRRFRPPTPDAATAPVSSTTPNPRTRIRPAQPGCSVGFKFPESPMVMAGTFGALVKRGNTRYILSNNHVLADENQLPIGSPIFQPGLLDGGNTATDTIAELSEFVKLTSASINKVDAAIARVLDESQVSNKILFIGPPQGVAAAALDMMVHKFGRTTGYRVGRVTSVETDVTVNYETGQFTFEDQIIIVGLDGRSFSDSGDSGSLILDRSTQAAIGLLFAGSETHTIANHIQDVLHALNVTLA